MRSLHDEQPNARLADVQPAGTTVLQVKARISVPLTTPDALVTESGSKLPLWAASDDDLRLLASHMADEMVAKAAKQRAAALATQPDGSGGFLLQAMRERERQGKPVHYVEDERAPGKLQAEAEAKGLV